MFSITSDMLGEAMQGAVSTLAFKTMASPFTYMTLLFIIPVTVFFFNIYKKHIDLYRWVFIPIFFIISTLILTPATVLLFYNSMIKSTLGVYYSDYIAPLTTNLISAFIVTVLFYNVVSIIMTLFSILFSVRAIKRVSYRFRRSLSHFIMPRDNDYDIECEAYAPFLKKDIDKRAQKDLEMNNIGGASIIVKQKGRTIYKNCFGNAKEDSLFRIASMTKPVTAVAALILVSRGQLGLDDLVEDYLPNFADMDIAELDENGEIVKVRKAETKITIRHLLTHTSGIGSGEVELRQVANMTDEVKASLSASVDFYAEAGLAFEPFTKQMYSGRAAFDVLALIIENITGMDYNDFLREEIFEPCDMVNTTFVPSEEQWEKIIPMHNKVDGVSCEFEMHDGCVFESYPCTHYLGGAGLVSTLEDYSNFAEMLLNKGRTAKKQIVPEELIEEMATPHVPEEIMPGKERWGLGVRVITNEEYKKLPVGTFGWSGAYGTHFWVDPENKITAVYMKNSKFDGGSGADTSDYFELDVHNSLIRI